VRWNPSVLKTRSVTPSLGGDADTLAAIAGPIAEAMQGIPEVLKAEAEDRYLTGASDTLEIIKTKYAFKKKK